MGCGCDEEVNCPGCVDCGCTVCGQPVRWGSRHHDCGTKVMAARKDIKDMIDRMPDGNIPDVERFVRAILTPPSEAPTE